MKPLSSNLLSAAAIPPLTVGAAFGRRGRRCPAVAHGGSVSASLRLPSGARLGVASHNSMRSLRSLRSNRCDESEHEAREVARRPQGCAPQRPTIRPRLAPPSARATSAACLQRTPPCLGKGAGGWPAARLCAAEKVSTDTNGPGDRLCLANGRASWPGAACKARASGPRAYPHASSSDSQHRFDHSERSERRALCSGARRPSIAGHPEQSEGQAVGAPAPYRPRACADASTAVAELPRRAAIRKPFHASRAAHSAMNN